MISFGCQNQTSVAPYTYNFVGISNCIDYCYKVANVPSTYKEAISSHESQKWQLAMNEEIQALRNNDTFELSLLPKNHRVVSGKWVYTIKSGPNNEEKFKARFVAKGFTSKKC